jgi:pSer/pThr/pTyr-binding forkhead associated (FHA) protein
LKFEIVYTTGVQHEVELQGHTLVVGRDPSCDIVLNDAKCSRRHAIVEMGPSGLMVRDNGSANGVFVNGRKVERSPLIPGDIIRIGETILKVLAESTGTLVMDANEYQETEDLTRPQELVPVPDDSTTSDLPAATPPPPPPRSDRPSPPPVPPPVPPPPRPPPSPGPKSLPPRSKPSAGSAPVPRAGLPRPLTVTVLAVMWLLAGAVYGALGLGYAFFGARGSSAMASAVAGLAMAGLSWIVGFGLWARAPWARLLQLVLAAIGIFTCVFTLPSIVILAYLWRPEVQLHFAGPRMLSAEESERAHTATPETAFTFGIVGTLLVSLILAAGVSWFARTWLRRPEVPPGRGETPGSSASPIPVPGATPH